MTKLFFIIFIINIQLLTATEVIFFGSGIKKDGSVLDYKDTDFSWRVKDVTYGLDGLKYDEPIIFPLVTSYPGSKYKKSILPNKLFSIFNFNDSAYVTRTYSVGKFAFPFQDAALNTKIIISPYISPTLKQYVDRNDDGSAVSSYRLKQCFCTKSDEKPIQFEFTAHADNHGEFFLNGEKIGSSELRMNHPVGFEFTAKQNQLKAGINCLEIDVENYDYVTGVSLVGSLKRNKIKNNIKWREIDGEDVCQKIKPDQA